MTPIERAARALACSGLVFTGETADEYWQRIPERTREGYLDDARAVLQAIGKEIFEAGFDAGIENYDTCEKWNPKDAVGVDAAWQAHWEDINYRALGEGT